MGGAPRGEPPGRFVLGGGLPVLALTQDADLLETLRSVTDSRHEICAAGSEIDFSAALLTQHPGVAVLDCAAVTTPVAQLTERLAVQFPDLVLIVAGGLAEQALLAPQIAAGSVHRFLHKPVSEQRVRLFVEAAWRRHGEIRATPPRASPPPPAARRGRAAIAWLSLTACAVIAAPLLWLGTHLPQPPPAAPLPGPAPGSAASSDAALESLLSRADSALGRGALTAPAGASAADLYREALRRNARDPRALHGLDEVIERLLAEAEAQLRDGKLDAAQKLADEARAINPDHPRVAFLEAQIGTARESAVLAKAHRAAAGGDIGGALAVLDQTRRGARHSTLIDEARVELAQRELETRIADFLKRGHDAFGRGALIAPPQDNARFYIESARALAPADERVREATQDLIARLESEARQALAARDAQQADSWANAAQEAGADPARVAALHADARQLREAALADSFAALARTFNERLAQGELDEPVADSAKFYLAQLTSRDPAHPSTQQARTAYAARVLDAARGTLQAQDFAATHHWIAEARAADADTTATGRLEAALAAAESEAQQANLEVAETTLKRTRYLAPRYPPEALQRGIEGWVDLQFIVGPDGAVDELKVVGAQPVGVFEQAALDAVRRWRYQPVVRGGRTVSQRTQLRLRFRMEQ